MEMISKKRLKLIHSLEKKKYRNEEQLFVAEGHKLVGELCATMHPQYVVATEEWACSHADVMARCESEVVTPDELTRISLLRTPQQVLALFAIPHDDTNIADVASTELCIALDGVQDPGNIGTIVRVADWFGIRHIFCSHDTVDIYNPKATQATMGALARVKVHYVDLPEQLAQAEAPVYGTHLDGENLYAKSLTQHGVIVMGNEGKGISPGVEALVGEKLYIPPYPADASTVESLNVAIATAIVCGEFRRRSSPK